MYEQEQKRATHLMVLLWNTILSASMIIFTLSHGQGPMATVLLSTGLLLCWIVHFTGVLPSRIRLWLYTAMLMLTFFYFGAREGGVSDMAPITVSFILVYVSTENPRFIRLCAAVFYLTMIYDFFFLPAGAAKLDYFRIDRVSIDLLIVLLSERMGETIIQKFQRDRKHTEETIVQLQEANRSAEDFLANASHELRTPVNAVTGITTMMLKTEHDEDKRKNLSAVQMAGNRLFNQIEDVLDYSEVDTGRLCVSEEAYSIPSLVNDIIAENRLMDNPMDVELIFDIDAKIPASLLGDGRKIRKIIAHLTDNAVKFTKTGGVHVRIFALHKPYGINLCIRVSDTGIGIAADKLEKIREKFFQSSGGRNRKSSGLGLGLSIVYGMVAAMDGFVQMESTEGVGTVVSVSIPQKVADASPCMDVNDRAGLTGLACYIKPEKYAVPEVRGAYNEAITHMVRELELPLHRVYELEELKRLTNSLKLSHLFIGSEEYAEDTAYFEQLNQSMEVVMIADATFRPAEGSRLRVIKKPLCTLSIANVLNAVNDAEEDAANKEILRCPGVRVLVVDDEPMNLLVVEGIFGAWDMEVTTAASGAQAIELCRQAEFDLIFLDHMMPEMDGVETLKNLRKIWTSTGHKPVVIAFSANVVSGAREMFLREGFDDFISKPIADRALKRLLRKVLPESAIIYAAENGAKAETDQFAGWEQKLEAKGFHIEAGLQYCNHDSALYADVLLRFAQDAERKIAQLADALQNEDCKQYQISVHALKSTAKMVGADTLSQQAKAAETAAKELDTAYLHAHHDDLMARYRDAAQCIGDVLRPAETDAGEAISRAELLERLRAFKEALDTYESDKTDALLTELSGFICQGVPVRELIQAIRQDVDDFEWAAATEKTDALISSLEGGDV